MYTKERLGSSALAKPLAIISSLATSLVRLTKRERFFIGFLLLLVFCLHLFILPVQDELIYDEAYYVPAANALLENHEALNPEHPPLGKLFIALGITVFGDNQWGWRIPSIMFSVALILIFYLICREITSPTTTLLSVLLFAFETLVFNFAGLAMLVVFSTTFMTLAFLLYLRSHYTLSGVSLALSGLCRMTGILGLLVIMAHWIIVRRKKKSFISISKVLISVIVAFFILMPLLDFATTRVWLNPLDRLVYMLTSYQSSTFEQLTTGYQAAQAQPLEWILDPTGFYWKDHLCYAQISFTVWVFIVPSMLYAFHAVISRRSNVALFAILWFAATYLPLLILVLLIDRVTYLYYFFPAVGAVCMAIGYAASRVWNITLQRRKAIRRHLIRATIIAYLILHILFFVVFTPILIALSSYLSS